MTFDIKTNKLQNPVTDQPPAPARPQVPELCVFGAAGGFNFLHKNKGKKAADGNPAFVTLT